MRRLISLAVGIAVLLGGAVAYVVSARNTGAATNAVPVVEDAALHLDRTDLFFRNLADGPDQGKLAAVPAADPGAARRVGELSCDRFAAARGTAICLRLQPAALPPLTDILVLDRNLSVIHEETLPGTPSRARVAPNGRIVNWTLFVSGDSYAASGFSTRTGMYNLDTDELTKTVEQLPIFIDGKRYFASDVNFWGITFDAAAERFYVTMASKGKTYLIDVDFAAYQGKAIAQNVECPSLSPDGRRIAYKQKIADGKWRLAVMELATGKISHPADDRLLDDQPVWKDDKTLIYPIRTPDGKTGIWSVGLTGPPKLLVDNATSPSLGGLQ
ncbi:hypothetical protein HPO96_06250 [Kribbella sandramycini]|uniref:WD40 repeat protein n=1 Tax=Kribbella sandramycini TaxID=60450 RepID=A0A7Y4KW63_9ACTN|nr:hypothetical protein [Kribbella sandramycini]MBB6567556.1 hypothetical protein [Kribbella sandramycini]NOL39840.1 hypothetical protein [Kribbella sandramycini]